ncbi:MAG: hypothetical protein HN352_12415 [Bacteroidetes bacterium]|jgi:hypothetical protein|nr:hypothetical protein [Bacteroidota bacterium]MBT4399910.1 hypothetical protein [Bacteroidota bacterium]MBT4409834.1 hypothetical protein [Bacteroidota bacterium]MBT7463458.1 hypothetical protein [Bacteroidota bacterium]
MKTLLLSFCLLITIIPSGLGQDDETSHVKVFILAGQSNMDGCGISEELPKKYKVSPSNVIVWDNNEKIWVGLTETTFSSRRDMQFGPEMAFAHVLSKAYPNNTIAIVKTSGGGTKLYNHWLPDSTMYRRCMQNYFGATDYLLIKDLMPFDLSGMLWMQGESDSETLEMANAYEKNLKVMFADIREKTKEPNLPIIMGRISSSLLKETPWVFDHTKIVQAAQEAVAAKDPHVHIINTDKLSTLEDNTHFDTKAQLKLGKKMARLILTEIREK